MPADYKPCGIFTLKGITGPAKRRRAPPQVGFAVDVSAWHPGEALHEHKPWVYICAMQSTPARHPDWDRLYETAAAQEGLVTAAQAAEAGYYPQLLMKHLQGHRLQRVRRSIYRLVHFPSGEHEDLVALWLWAERAGVFSQETALALHELSDALPALAHLTVPASWSKRRLRVPAGVALHFDDIPPGDRAWVGSLPVTTVARTLADCAAANVPPGLVRDAFEEAANRGLIGRNEVPGVIAYLKSFYLVSRSASGPRFGSASGGPPRHHVGAR